MGLEAGDGTAEFEGSLGLVHTLALVHDALEPVVRGFNLASHVGELHADDRVVDELLPEGLALVRVLHGILVADTGKADALDDDANTLMVEVGHDDLEALVLLAKQVLHGDLDVLEGNIGGAAAPDTLAVHAAGADTARLPFDEEEGESVHAALASADGSSEVVGPAAVGDPLLLTIDNIVLAILRQLSLAGKVGNITASIRLSNGQTDTLITVDNARQDPVDERLLAELDKRRATNAVATEHVPHHTTAAGARELIRQNHLVEEIPVLRSNRLHPMGSLVHGVLDTEQTGQITLLTHRLVELRRNLLALFPVVNEGLDLVLDELPDLVAEGGVGLIEVGRVVLFTSQPGQPTTKYSPSR